MTEQEALAAMLTALDEGGAGLDALVAARPREGRFFGELQRLGLDDTEVELVLAALASRLSGELPCTGAELARRTGAGSARRLAALARLTADGALVARGLLQPDISPLDSVEAEATSFRLGERLLRAASGPFAPPPAAPPPDPTPYASNAALLSDLRRLSQVYRRRAARLFRLDPWSATELDSSAPAGDLLDLSRSEAARVQQRLALTTLREQLPLLVLADEHRLDLDALVVLATLLFQEVLEGVGAVDAVDLVRLVSESEHDLIKRRTMLQPLERRGLLRLEGAYAGKDLTADASLPESVLRSMLGSPRVIDTDDRIDFHAYLSQLDSSDSFFDDLHGQSPPDAD